MRHLLTCLLLLLPLPLWADCEGRDLRQDLSSAEQSLLRDRLAERPFPNGNHWRATKGDEVLHLVGTMHLADPRFDPVMTRLAPVVDSAATVLLEVTATEEAQLEAALNRDPSLLVLTDASLPDLMGADWDLLAQAMQARGLPPFMAAKFQPWYVAVLLSMPSCLPLENLQIGGLDDLIETRATDQGIPTGALEGFDTALAAFGDVPLDQQIAMLRAALVPDTATNDMFTTMGDSYFDETHAEVWALTEVLSERFGMLDPAQSTEIFTTMENVLLTRRNRAWIPVMLDTLANTDGPVLAAFGAAHLNGSTGVLALLEAEGFALEQRPFQ